MADKKKSTVEIPRSVYTALASMKRGVVKCDAYEVIMAYAADGSEPIPDDYDGVVMTLFDMAKALMDARTAQA